MEFLPYHVAVEHQSQFGDVRDRDLHVPVHDRAVDGAGAAGAGKIRLGKVPQALQQGAVHHRGAGHRGSLRKKNILHCFYGMPNGGRYLTSVNIYM